MNHQSVDQQPAYLIHRRPYRETAVLLDVLTPEYGLKGLVAHGARRARSTLAGLLQPNRPLLVSWRSRTELGTVRAVDSAGPAFRLAGRALWCSLYLSELIQRLLDRDEPCPELFAHYQHALDRLQYSGRDAGSEQTVLRTFERRLLDALGYGLILDVTGDTAEPLQAGRDYRYQPDAGALAAGTGGGVVVGGRSLLAMARDDYTDPRVRDDAKRLMRVCLAVHLGAKPLVSRALFGAPGTPEG